MDLLNFHKDFPKVSEDIFCCSNSSIYTVLLELIQKRLAELSGSIQSDTTENNNYSSFYNFNNFHPMVGSTNPEQIAGDQQQDQQSGYSESPEKFVTMLATWATILSFAGIFYGKMFISKGTRKFLINLKTFIEDFALLIITITWLLLAAIPYGILLSWRFCIFCYIKMRYGRLSNLVSGLDAMAILDSENSKQIIKSIKVLEGQINLSEFREKVMQTVMRTHPENDQLVYPKFHQYLKSVGGFFTWLPSEFDINYHVRFIDGFDENSPSMSESQSLKILSDISNDYFEKHKSPWEILVIPNFHYDVEGPNDKNPKKSAIMIRIHHGIGDGYSLMKLILRDMAGGEKVEIPQIKRENRSILYGIAVFFYIIFKSPRSFYYEMLVNDINPLHNSSIKITGKKSILWSNPIDVHWLKDIKNKMGYGMNTMLLSSMAGSLSRYMKEEYKSNELKSMTALLPMPAPNHPDNQMVNKFSIVLFPLSHEYEDPLERSKEIYNQGKIIAQSPDAILNLFLMNLCGVMPAWFSRVFIINKQSTILISNIPGPTKEISIWGKKLKDNMFWLPHLGDSGVSVSFLSYTNHLRIGITVDSGIVKDEEIGAQRLLDGMVQELLNMSKALQIPCENVIKHLVKTREELDQLQIEEVEAENKQNIEIIQDQISDLVVVQDPHNLISCSSSSKENSDEETQEKENIDNNNNNNLKNLNHNWAIIRKRGRLLRKSSKFVQDSVKNNIKIIGKQEIITR